MKSFVSAAVLSLAMADEAKYMQFISRMNKSYATREEFNFRMNLFMEKEALINSENAKPENTWVAGHNEYSDWTEEEFKSMLGYKIPERTPEQLAKGDVLPAPNADTVNWVTSGHVTPVMTQGPCGSGWIIAVVGAIEAAYVIDASVPLQQLSSQQIIDCDTDDGNKGCDGGNMDLAYKYSDVWGMIPASQYPYVAKKQNCQYQEPEVVMEVDNWSDVAALDTTSLKAAVADRPVSVMIEADRYVMQIYQSGVLNSEWCGTNMDHGVLIVGYGTEADQEYWLVKNSWGTTWGEEGYVKIAIVDGKGICGIQQYATRPTYVSVW